MEIFKLFGSVFVETDQANEAMSETDRQAQELGGRFGELAANAGAMALKIGAAVGVIAVGLGTKGVLAADSLNQAMNKLQSQTGASSEEMAGLEEIAKRIYGANYGESFDDIAKAMSEISRSTDLAGDALEGVTKNALVLRDTFEFDVNESARAASALMKNFGVTGEEAYNLIAQAAQQGADKNGDLLDTLNEYSVQFASLGFDAEDFGSALVAGAEAGAFSIDKVGDAIKEFNIRAKDGSKTTTDAFKALGFDAEKMGQAFAAGGDSARQAFFQVGSALESIQDPLQRNQIGVALFGTQFEDLEQKGISALINLDGYVDLAHNSLAEINAIRYDDFGSAIAGIGRQFETGLFIPLGQMILPKLNELASWISANMPVIQANIETALGVATTVFDGFVAVIKFAIDNGNILIPVITGLTAAILAQQAIGSIVTLYKAWQAATTTQTTLQWLLNAALSANPLGLVAIAIGAVVAAGVLLYQNWDTVKVKANELWSKIKEVFGGIRDFGVQSWDEMWGSIKSVINSISKGVNTLINGLNKIKINIPDWVPGMGGKQFGINIPTIPMLAKGTDYFKGGTALVGEQGPELVKLPTGSQVVPNGQTQQMLQHPEYIVVEVNLDSQKMAQVMAKPINKALGNLLPGAGREVGVVF